jgi:hypothetical protein
MATIYLAFNSPETNHALELRGALQHLGHEVKMDVEMGVTDWGEAARIGLQNADVFVPIFGDDIFSSLSNQTAVALGYSQTSERLKIVPIAKDPNKLPANMTEFLVLRLEEDNHEELAKLISDISSEWVGQRIARQEKAQIVAQRLEERSSDYVDEAIHNQKAQARLNRIFGVIWYGLGFISLISALIIVIMIYNNSRLDDSDFSFQSATLLGLRIIVVVGLLGAAAKYGLNLGRSYTSESLKNLDRVHAISFGKFYLRAYGETATWQELKEVFQYWNIDRSSSFSAQEAHQIDPALGAQFIEALKGIGKGGGT